MFGSSLKRRLLNNILVSHRLAIASGWDLTQTADSFFFFFFSLRQIFSALFCRGCQFFTDIDMLWYDYY